MKRRILTFVFWAIALMSAPELGHAVTASVTVSINQSTYEAGETIDFGLSASKTSSVSAVDIYAGALLPDRQTVILILSGDPGFAIRNLSETGSWHPLIGGAGASGDWGVQLMPAARYTFNGAEPPGCYVGFAALVATENNVVALATASYSTGTTFVFDAGVPEEHQKLIRHTVGAATCFYGTHGLGSVGYVTLYALSSLDEIIRVYKEHLQSLGVPDAAAQKQSESLWRSGASGVVTGPGAVFFNVASEGWRQNAEGGFVIEMVAHELFHAVQERLAEGRLPGPTDPQWLREGGASYLQLRVGESEGVLDFGLRREWFIGRARSTSARLASLETWSGFLEIGADKGYGAAFAAVELLIATSGLQSLNTFWTSIGMGSSWQDAFQRAFGIDIATFYVVFEEYRATL